MIIVIALVCQERQRVW